MLRRHDAFRVWKKCCEKRDTGEDGRFGFWHCLSNAITRFGVNVSNGRQLFFVGLARGVNRESTAADLSDIFIVMLAKCKMMGKVRISALFQDSETC